MASCYHTDITIHDDLLSNYRCVVCHTKGKQFRQGHSTLIQGSICNRWYCSSLEEEFVGNLYAMEHVYNILTTTTTHNAHYLCKLIFHSTCSLGNHYVGHCAYSSLTRERLHYHTDMSKLIKNTFAKAVYLTNELNHSNSKDCNLQSLGESA